MQWSSNDNGSILLFAGFGNGRIASYALKEDEIYPAGILDIGSPVRKNHGLNLLFLQ